MRKVRDTIVINIATNMTPKMEELIIRTKINGYFIIDNKRKRS